MSFEIRIGTIHTIVHLSQQIEEFFEPHGEEVYEKRLKNVPSIILVAYVGERPIGFKVGYERDGSFYSWMGGVIREWRRKGIAKALADRQEAWARQQGYRSITFKTRNRLKGMLLFAIGNGFDIIAIEPREHIDEYRILLRKELLPLS